MTIKVRLSIIVLGLVAACIGSAGIYIAILSPIKKIRTEQAVLNVLRATILDREIEANRLLIAPDFKAAADKYDAGIKLLDEGFSEVRTLRTLPKVNAQISSSIDAINSLSELINDYNSALSISIKDLRTAVSNEIGGKGQLLDMIMTASSSTNTGFLRFVTNKLVVSIDTLSFSLETSASVIDKQYAEIAKEINRVESRSSKIAIAAILVFLALAILVTFRATSRISSSIGTVKGGIKAIKGGDLAAEFPPMQNDEIGDLSQDLSSFVAGLRDSIALIQEASSENISMKESLLATSENASTSANQISANNESISNRMTTLDESISNATTAVDGIAGNIGDLDSRIQEQMSRIEESTASVTHMIASIDSVAKITNQRRGATDRLVGTVASGGEKMAGTVDVIKRIGESVGSIEEITEIISNLSSQTNVLAMNAAIEAAHAGDAGRGFSVVADEIRKLAEASSINSMEIGAILKGIVSHISEATKSGVETDSAFKQIDNDVHELRSSLEEIFSNMSELHSGGEQILEAMTVLSEVSARVNDGSSSIRDKSTSIRSSMVGVKNISAEVAGSMSEISIGMQNIARAVQDVWGSAERLGKIGESLNAELSRFKTTKIA
jgi:methyl-accepting chemotaxis protein